MTKTLLIHSLFVAFNQNPAEKGFNSLILISLTDQKHPFWQKRKRTKIISLQHNFDNKLSKTEALIIISSSAINCALWDYDCFTVNMQTTDIHTFCMIFLLVLDQRKLYQYWVWCLRDDVKAARSHPSEISAWRKNEFQWGLGWCQRRQNVTVQQSPIRTKVPAIDRKTFLKHFYLLNVSIIKTLA